MYQQSFSVGGETALTVQIEHGGGDLHLIGTDETYARIQGEGDAADYRTSYQNGTLTLSLHGDCVLFVPRALNLTVAGRFGDLHAGDLSGSLAVDGGHGDVVITGATGAVQLSAVMGDLRASELGSLAVSQTVHGDAVITSVAGAVKLSGVSGDLHVSEAGSLECMADVSGSAKVVVIRESARLADIAGDLIVRGAHSFSARTVHGDLRASDIAGDLSLAGVNGDVKVKQVGGSCSIAHAGGDAQLSRIGGSLSSFSAGGDLHLQGALPASAEGHLDFVAGGDLVLRLPPATAARFECTAGGDIVNRFSGEKSRSGHGQWKGSIGTGGPLVNCTAGGDIRLKPEEGGDVEIRFEINKEEMRQAQEEVRRAKEEVKRIKREVRDQVHIHKDDIHRTIHESMRSFGENFGAGADFNPGADFERAFRGQPTPRPPRPPRPPRAARGPQPPTPPGSDTDFPFNMGGFLRRFRFGPGGDSPAAPRARKGVSDEERMTILKMLEEKRITPEQAELLLNALGEE